MHLILSWINKLGLWPRTALGVSVGFLFLLLAFLLLGESILRETTDRLLQEQLGIARIVAGQIDGVIAQALTELETAQNFADFNPADPDLSAEVHVLSHTFGQIGTFATGIVFLDNQGGIILTSPPNLYSNVTDLNDLAHISEALTSQAVVISEPFLSPLDSRPVAALTIPLKKEDQLEGLLSGLIDLQGELIVSSLNQAGEISETGRSHLIDQNGRVIVSTAGLGFLAPGEDPGYYQQTLSQQLPAVGAVSSPGSSRQELIVAIVPLENAPWGVVVGRDEDDLLAGVTRLRSGLIVLGGAAILAIWVLTLLGTRRLVMPVHRLKESAEKIAAGELDSPLSITEGGEIGALAEVLDNMRRQLQEQIQALETSKGELESRVLARTEALAHQQTLTRQLLRRVISAQEEERARISRELHDDTGQTLTAVQINLDRLNQILGATDPDVLEQSKKVQDLTQDALASLRGIIADLRPGVLDQLGLLPALEWMAENTLQPLGINSVVEYTGLADRLPETLETILYRIAQEAVSNVARHSQAKNFRIQFEVNDDQINMELTDDGTGFNPLLAAADPEFRSGLGLASMQERASLAGGKVVVESAPKRGTTIHVGLPHTRVPTSTRRESVS